MVSLMSGIMFWKRYLRFFTLNGPSRPRAGVRRKEARCLVIDDPLLRPTYGFVDYRELLSLMQRYKFSTNIAFIPWNWRRSDSGITRLFRENPEYYSISVHGCAHTRAEFGSDDSEHLYAKTRQALERMDQHEAATGLAHDRVMVFPQGVFSEAAMRILKRTDLIAAVNNDTISFDRNPRPITVADVWDTAIMAYDNFALFTRRYPWSGVENFAFDSLLGKPVIIVIHHGFCRDHCIRLIEFMERLNALPCPLIWRSLGELVKRSCRQRALSPDVTQVEMYGKELRVENLSDRTKQFLIRRRESNPSLINEVFAGRRHIAWNGSDDRIQFEVEVKAGENVTIRLHLHELGEMKERVENLNDRARTMLRRYLCELRDNYVHKLTSLVIEWALVRNGKRTGRKRLFRSRSGLIGRAARQLALSNDRPAPKEDSELSNKVAAILTRFTQWLDSYGETSWDHQSFFAGPVGGKAKALYYRHGTIGHCRGRSYYPLRSVSAVDAPFLSSSNSFSDRRCALCNGFFIPLPGQREVQLPRKGLSFSR